MPAKAKAEAKHEPKGIALKNLQAWRTAKDWTQKHLAEEAKVARATITRAEAGEPVRVLTVARLAKALEISQQTLREEEPKGA